MKYSLDNPKILFSLLLNPAVQLLLLIPSLAHVKFVGMISETLISMAMLFHIIQSITAISVKKRYVFPTGFLSIPTVQMRIFNTTILCFTFLLAGFALGNLLIVLASIIMLVEAYGVISVYLYQKLAHRA